MKVLGVLGSPRVGGNSDILLNDALRGARDAGATARKVILARKRISGCLDCTKCNRTGVCAIEDDMPAIHRMILGADCVIHSVPVYFWSMTGQMKAYLDRWCAFFDANWRWHEAYASRMKGKRVGLITVCGDPNVHTADPIVHVFKTLSDYSRLAWLGAVQASATARGEIAGNEAAREAAYTLGQDAAQ